MKPSPIRYVSRRADVNESMPIPCSVFVITKNEAANLPRLLDNVRDFAEVVIVDSGSTDATVAIAESYPNTRVSFNAWPGFGPQKAHALSLCRHDWVLNLDADETVSVELLAEIRTTVNDTTVDALRCRRQLLRWGQTPRNFDREDVLIRLFRRSHGHYDDRQVHESIHVEGRIRDTRHRILHHENLNFDQRLQKSLFYARLKATDKFRKGHRTHLLVLLLIGPWTLVRMLLFRGHILDGTDGLLTSANAAFYNFLKYALLWEMTRRQPPVD